MVTQVEVFLRALLKKHLVISSYLKSVRFILNYNDINYTLDLGIVSKVQFHNPCSREIVIKYHFTKPADRTSGLSNKNGNFN